LQQVVSHSISPFAHDVIVFPVDVEQNDQADEIPSQGDQPFAIAELRILPLLTMHSRMVLVLTLVKARIVLSWRSDPSDPHLRVIAITLERDSGC
jgi:hypothetical protein